MGARFLTWAHDVELCEHPGVTRATQRHVLVMLANHANRKGEAWPAVARMAKSAYLSRTTVRLALDALHADGLIALVGDRSGGHAPTHWRVQPVSHQPVQPVSHRPDAKRDNWSVAEDNRSVAERNRSATGAEPAEPAQNPKKGRGRAYNETRSAPTSSRRQGGGAPTPSVPSSQRNEGRQRAEAFLRQEWEAQTPRPQQPWPAALQATAKALRGGWSEAELHAFIADDGFPISGGALDRWRSKRRNGQRGQGATVEGALAVADAIRRHREALQQ